MTWRERFVNQVVHGDCYQLLQELPAKSVDLLVTDPPYGIEFMGKLWDRAVPSVRIWKECLRVLKPGSFAFIMCAPRLDCMSEMGQRLQQAGFAIGFTPIFWAFASGFPKAQNVSKAIDKQKGVDQEIIGSYIHPRSIEQNKERDNSWGEFSLGKPETRNVYGKDNRLKKHRMQITEPVTPEAQALDGAYGGFQPKPAVELILVAMKSLAEATFPEQALMTRTGVTWLDDGRIPYTNPRDKLLGQSERQSKTVGIWDERFKPSDRSNRSDLKGRFPANLLVSDAVLDDGTIYKRSQKSMTGEGRKCGGFGGLYKPCPPSMDYGDEGGFSRYFSLDAWWAARIAQLPENVRKTFPFLIVPKASKAEKNQGLESFPLKQTMGGGGLNSEKSDVYQAVKAKQANFHPTVKPITLMSYLVTIGSREGDLVLDPFAGTGTTGIACQLLHRAYALMEIDATYCEIAQARLQSYTRQKTLFDFGDKKAEKAEKAEEV